MYREGVAYKLRSDRGSSAPGFDNLFLVLIVECINLLLKFEVHKRAFFK
jgi:hypothetical protein